MALTNLSNCSITLLTLVLPTISKFLINLLTTQPQWTVMVLATVSAVSLLCVCSPTTRRWCSQVSPWSRKLQLGSCRGVEDTPDRFDWRRESSCWTRDGYWSTMGREDLTSRHEGEVDTLSWVAHDQKDHDSI